MRGITVVLINRVKVGSDPFNKPIYEEVEKNVDNVLVYPGVPEDVISDVDLEGKKSVHTLGIPKGDTNNWIDCKVRFKGRTYKSFGFPQEGIEELVPTAWHKKVMVELYG